MRKILLAVDGSPNAHRAAEFVARLAREVGGARVHVLNVQPSLPGDVATFVAREDIEDFRREQSEPALAPAAAVLEEAGVEHDGGIGVGPVAETIVRYASEHGFDHIVVGSRGLGPVQGLILGSVASEVLRLATVPVTVVR